MTSPLTYEIRSVHDFLTVPIDRLVDCLHEFPVWLATMAAIRATMGDLVKLPQAFIWIDDGKRTYQASFVNAETGEHIASFVGGEEDFP